MILSGVCERNALWAHQTFESSDVYMSKSRNRVCDLSSGLSHKQPPTNINKNRVVYMHVQFSQLKLSSIIKMLLVTPLFTFLSSEICGMP